MELLRVTGLLFLWTGLALAQDLAADITCDDVTCDLFCDTGFKRDVNSCPICECEEPLCKDVHCAVGKICKVFQLSTLEHKITRCVDPSLPEQCLHPADEGPCQDQAVKFFYNTETEMCEPFYYGGCDGNSNLFNDASACESVCGDTCPEVTCDMFCENGFQVDERGCKTCVCDATVCPPFTCEMFCDYGLMKDGNGCDMCQCEPCPQFICQMYCENGLKVDTDGCQYCECNDPQPSAECAPFMCQMYCETGMQIDANGCPVCACREPVQCPDVTCDMFCEDGFAKDADGCDTCSCASNAAQEKPSNCGDVMCMMYCEDGFQVDAETGCEICRCKGWGPVGPVVCDDVECQMYCEFGFIADYNGCRICECQDDPCEAVECPEGKKCIVEAGQNLPTCVAVDVRTWCPDVMCAMYCDHGFRSDQLGCHICKCLDEPKPECPDDVICQRECPFGFKYNEFGCSGCQCLPDPCSTQACDMTHVCETTDPECPTCPSTAICIGITQVQRIRIEVTYAHETVADLNLEDFAEEVERRMTYLLDTDDEYIRGVNVEQIDSSRTRVTFHLVSYGQGDIVKKYESFEISIKTHQEGTAVSYNEVVYIPEHDSVFVSYYRDPDFDTDEDSWEDDDEDEIAMGVIIGCSVAGAIALILLIVVIVFIVKAKKQGSGKPNVQYQKAPDGTQSPEKEPLPVV